MASRQSGLCGRRQRKRTLDEARRRGARLFRPESADSGDGEEMARAPMIRGAGQPGTGNSCRRWRKKCVRTPSSVPVVPTIRNREQRIVLPVYLPRRTGPPVARDGDQRRDELAAAVCDCRLAHAEQSEVVASAWRSDLRAWAGIHYSETVPIRVWIAATAPASKAVRDSGVATRPIADFDAYIDKLTEFVQTNLSGENRSFPAGTRKDPRKRVVLPEGEEARVPHATRELITLGLA